MPVIDVQTYLEGYPLPGINQTGTQLMQALNARQIHYAVARSARALYADPLTGNRILKAMLEQTQGLYGCLTTHMNRTDASLEAVREMLGSRRFVGVMLACADPQEPLNLLVADEILNSCRRYQKPVFVQTPSAACVESAVQLAKKYGGHKFVFLGMGGPDWRAGIAAAQQLVNIYLETSGVLDCMKIQAAIDTLGSHRLLFGSGMPDLDAAAALGMLEDAAITPAGRRHILFDNAARLFGLEDLDAAGA